MALRDCYYAVYGVDVSLTLSPLRGPLGSEAGAVPTAPGGVQPVLAGVTRFPELPTVAAAVFPPVYADLISTLLLGRSSNTTRVL